MRARTGDEKGHIRTADVTFHFCLFQAVPADYWTCTTVRLSACILRAFLSIV